MQPLPSDVLEWLRMVFRTCNERITTKLSNNPNIPEEQLDLTWIEHLSQYSSAIRFPSAWTVRIDTHYLGGLRHYYRWEIADVGLLVFFRQGGVIERSKVALLQSKRLYPSKGSVEEESKVDYEVGFGRLADPEVLARSIGIEAEFQFNDASRFGALIAGSDQVQSIDAFEEQNDLKVYYQLYNPWRLPFVQRIPLQGYSVPEGDIEMGVRVIPAPIVHSLLGKRKGARPKIGQLADLGAKIPAFGWQLETFIVDEFLACREGSVFGSVGEGRIQNLFYRRSGPISAAIAVSIEAPG